MIRVDARGLMRRKKLIYFAINVSLSDGDEENDVFRVDTAHRGLHVRKFWIGSEPKYLEEKRKEDYTVEFREWSREVSNQCRRWCAFWKKKDNGVKR